MGWYQVIKTVKGRKYRYQQRSFRVNGKVRTKSKYLGPVDRTEVTEANRRPEAKVGPTEPARVDTAENYRPTLRIQKAVRHRSDISEWALRREEELVLNRMTAFGLPVDDLKAIRVCEGRKVARKNKRSGYFVIAARVGQRNAFKREYRRALADRWLLELERHDPVCFNHMACLMDQHQSVSRTALTQLIMYSNTPHKFAGVLWFLWSGRLPADLRKSIQPQKIGMIDHNSGGWREEAVKLTAEVIQRGPRKIRTRYEAAATMAMSHLKLEEAKLVKMTWRHRLTGDYRRQARRVLKAKILRDTCITMERKVGVISSWYEIGEV